MLKRLFGQKQPPAASPVPSVGPAWSAPQARYGSYFNLHLYGLALEQAIAALWAKYGYAATTDAAILIQRKGEWINAYFAPELVAKVGFNKLASELAREQDTWLIGYRIYGGAGMDVHYFDRAEHVAGLALGEDELEREPLSSTLFAELADVSHLVPRPAAQHPLDFHLALLRGLGIHHADLTWQEALQEYTAGKLAGAHVLPDA